MTTVWDINLFYPLVILAVIVLIVTIGLVIKGRNSDFTFKDIFFKSSTDTKDIFFKSSDNAKEVAIDTTSKMKDMHDNVIKVDFTSSHEHELDEIEQTIDTHTTQLEQLTTKVEQIDVKVDELLNQFIELRKQNKI